MVTAGARGRGQGYLTTTGVTFINAATHKHFIFLNFYLCSLYMPTINFCLITLRFIHIISIIVVMLTT